MPSPNALVIHSTANRSRKDAPRRCNRQRVKTWRISVTLWSVPDLFDNLAPRILLESKRSYVLHAVRFGSKLRVAHFGRFRNPTDDRLATRKAVSTHQPSPRSLLPTVITSHDVHPHGKGAESNSNWRPNSYAGREASSGKLIRSRLNDSTVVTERLMAAPDYRNRGA